MCGIAGIIQFTANKDQNGLSLKRIHQNLNLMSEKIEHRGPDDKGIWISSDLRIGFAHRRLSIVDLSYSAHQPMKSNDSRYIVTFNGEIYNYMELRKNLQKKGVVFHSISDTEVLIECYREYGYNCLQYFDGMYAFVIYDKLKDEIFAARDPFGEKPFYYSWINESFIFASELSAITAVPGFEKTSDLETVSQFLCLQYVAGENTFYNNAKKLKPGHYLTLSNKNKLEVHRFFEFSPREESILYNEDDLVDELESLLIKNIERRLRADVSVGALLSGGLDSSLVVAIAKTKLNADIQTFTIGFENWADSEHKDAYLIASYLNTHHTEKLLKPDCYKLFEHLAKIIDEPNADTSLLPTYLVSQLAKKSVKVVLSGDGADELFGGYGRYISTLNESNSPQFDTGNNYYSNKILPFTEDELSRFVIHVPSKTRAFLNELRQSISQSQLNIINCLRKTDIENYLPGAVLAKVDRMSMQHGLEVRTPFLSIEMARFAEKIPSELLTNKNTGKILLKKLAIRYLPKKILNKQKKGFGMPFVLWGEETLLKNSSKALLSNNANKEWWLDNEEIKSWIKSGKKNNSIDIYKLWSLYHVDRFITYNKIIPPGKINPFHLWLLSNKLQKKPVNSIIFSILPSCFENKELKKFVINKSVWIDTSGVLNYKEENDWIKDFNSVFISASNNFKNIPLMIVFIGVTNCELYKNSQFLTNKGIQKVLLFEDNMWNEIILQNSDFFDKKMNEVYPVLFSIKENIFITHSFKNLLNDFLYFFKCTFFPYLLSFTEDPFLKEEKRYLLDVKSPFRAYALIKESIAALKYTYSEKKFIKDLKNEIKKGYKRDNTNKNKIIFILPSLYSGGAEKQACNLMVSLKRRKYDVKLLSLSPLVGSSKHYLPLLKEDHIELIDMSYDYIGEDFDKIKNNIPKNILNLLSHSNAIINRHIWPVFHRIYSENPNHVICFLDTPNIIGGISASLAGVPNIVTSFRNINPTSFSFYEKWYFPYYKALIKSPLLTMTGNSNIGNKSYANWLKIAPSKINLLRNGVDFSHHRHLNSNELNSIRNRLGINDNEILIGGVFRLSEEKRPELFIEAFIQIKKRIRNIKAFILGEGPLRSHLEELLRKKNISESLILVGPVKDVTPYIYLSSIVLQTSRTEGTANSLLEAQYLNKAVIATNGGGVSESLIDGETGYVINSTNPEIIAKKVVALLENKKLLIKMGVNGKKFVENNFSLSNSTDKLLVYCNAVSN